METPVRDEITAALAAEQNGNGTHPETRPVSKVLLAFLRRIRQEYEQALRQDITDAVLLGREDMGFPEGERWDFNESTATWTKHDG